MNDHTEHNRRAHNCLAGTREPYLAGAVCGPCSTLTAGAVTGVRIDGTTVTRLEAPVSLSQLQRMRSALDTIRSVTEALVVLGVLDAPEAAPLPPAVDQGILDRYESELGKSRDEIRASASRSDSLAVTLTAIARTFLSGEENEGMEDHAPEIWATALNRSARGFNPWMLQRANAELREEVGSVQAGWDEIALALATMTESRDQWQQRAREAERGQPKFSQPVPPADAPAIACIGEPDCPVPGHEDGCLPQPSAELIPNETIATLEDPPVPVPELWTRRTDDENDVESGE